MVEETRSLEIEHAQVVEDEREHAKLTATIAASLKVVAQKAQGFMRPRHPDASRLGRVLYGRATPSEVLTEAKAQGLDPKAIKAEAAKPRSPYRPQRPVIPDAIGPDAPPVSAVEDALSRFLAMLPKRPEPKPGGAT